MKPSLVTVAAPLLPAGTCPTMVGNPRMRLERSRRPATPSPKRKRPKKPDLSRKWRRKKPRRRRRKTPRRRKMIRKDHAVEKKKLRLSSRNKVISVISLLRLLQFTLLMSRPPLVINSLWVWECDSHMTKFVYC